MTGVGPGPRSLQGLPTLTEVIDIAPPREGTVKADVPPLPPSVDSVVAETPVGRSRVPSSIDDDELVDAVLADLQRHADLLLEYRLREALAPALARLSDSLIRDLQQELATTMRDVVAYAVSQQLARRRGR